HDQVAKSDTFPLCLLHPSSHSWHDRNVGHSGARLSGANLLRGIIAVNQETHFTINTLEGSLPTPADLSDGFGIFHIHPFTQAVPGQRAVHGPGVDISKTQGFGHTPGISAFAAG